MELTGGRVWMNDGAEMECDVEMTDGRVEDIRRDYFRGKRT
jgi:hypothetical protein